MRGITFQVVVSSLLSSKPKLGKPSKMTLLAFTSIWVLASWDYRRLHMSNAPISSAIRTASTTSVLTRTYRCHPCASTLVVTRKHNWMFFLYGNELCHWLVKDLTTWATWELGIDGQSQNHDQNICWTFQSRLLRNTRLSISLKIRCIIRRFISVFELRLSLVNLRGMTSVFLQLERSEPTVRT